MRLYTLRHKKEGWFAKFIVRSNGDDAEFCNDTSVELCRHGDNIWVSTSRDIAERVASASVPWYNSSVDWPEHQHAGELEVVEFTAVGT